MRLLLFAGIAAIAVTACKSNEYNTSKSGLQYRVHTSNKGDKIKVGDVVTLNGTETLLMAAGKDSQIVSTPMRTKVTEFKKTDSYLKRSITEVLTMMTKGDSASFVVPVDSLSAEEKEPSFKKGQSVRFDLKVTDVQSKEAYEKQLHEAGLQAVQQIKMYTENLKRENAAVATKDSADIEKWLKTKGINAMRTPSGLYYVVDNEGEGENLLPGQTAMVKYTGSLLDGKVFDSSEKMGQPLPVQLGLGRVILGWEEGLLHFKKGGKGKLIIPSYLGYGSKGAGADIPANAPLVFDIEVVDVK